MSFDDHWKAPCCWAQSHAIHTRNTHTHTTHTHTHTHHTHTHTHTLPHCVSLTVSLSFPLLLSLSCPLALFSFSPSFFLSFFLSLSLSLSLSFCFLEIWATAQIQTWLERNGTNYLVRGSPSVNHAPSKLSPQIQEGSTDCKKVTFFILIKTPVFFCTETKNIRLWAIYTADHATDCFQCLNSLNA